MKSRLACATVAGVAGRVSKCARSGTDGSTSFSLFFDDAVLLCFACVERLCAVELLRMCCTVVCCHSIVFCNSVSADRIGMAA